MTFPRPARRWIVLALLVSAAGCGGAEDGGDAERSSDQAAAERIRESAERRQAEADAVEAQAGRAEAEAEERPRPEEEPPSEAAPDPQGAGGLLSSADRASFEKLAAALPGGEGIAVAPLSTSPRVVRFGSVRGGTAWSTAKVPVAMAALEAGRGGSGDVMQAITASDNAAAERLWTSLGGGAGAAEAATRQLRASGDSRTTIQAQRLRSGFTAFGQTGWALTDQVRFLAGLGCGAGGAAGAEVLDLMGNVVSGQRWGLGSTGAGASFKGGWGPGATPGAADGWLERQMGIVDIGGAPVAVAIASTAPGHDAGIKALDGIASWLQSHVSADAAAAAQDC